MFQVLLLFTKEMGKDDRSGQPVGWLTFESMPTEWGLEYTFSVPDQLFAVVNRQYSRPRTGIRPLLPHLGNYCLLIESTLHVRWTQGASKML